jgi:Flp pilus assembly protein TadG
MLPMVCPAIQPSPPPPTLGRTSASSGGSRAGQALTEFVIILPLLFAIVGVTLDFARVYQTWMRLQAVTRDTAELLATDVTYVDQPTAQAAADARICTAMAGTPTCPAYVRPGSVTLTEVAVTTPTWSATVPAEYDFQTLFLWPVIRGLTGAESWTLRTQVTFEVIRWPR